MAITAKELARILNLSEAAVSMALNGKPGVSTVTRKRVFDTALAHDYDFLKIRDIEHRNLGGSICFAIYKKSGAVIADTPFFSSLTEGISNGCKKRHYRLNINYFYEDENLTEQVNLLKNGDYLGIILLATEMNSQSLTYFSDIKTPMVILDAYFDNLPYDAVLINNIQGAFIATDYLIKKCRMQPGYLHSSYSISNFEERADGFYKAIRKHGMPTSKSIVHRLTPSQEGAYEDMKALIHSQEELATCYFADNDLIAAGAMRAFSEAGYRLPEDISVVGFDNLPLGEYMSPALTTIDVPKQYMGEVATERIMQMVEGERHFPVKIEIGTTLKKRKSVKDLKNI